MWLSIHSVRTLTDIKTNKQTCIQIWEPTGRPQEWFRHPSNSPRKVWAAGTGSVVALNCRARVPWQTELADVTGLVYPKRDRPGSWSPCERQEQLCLWGGANSAELPPGWSSDRSCRCRNLCAWTYTYTSSMRCHIYEERKAGTHTRIPTCTCTHTRACIHVHERTHAHTSAQAHPHTHTRMCVFIQIFRYTYFCLEFALSLFLAFSRSVGEWKVIRLIILIMRMVGKTRI